MPTLYDHEGRPIRARELEREHARATLSGVRSPYTTSEASRLTPERLARLLRAADEGDTEAYFTLAEEMEVRDLHYGSVLRTRKLSVAGCAVQVEAISDDARDQEIADALREEVFERPELEDLVFDLMDGLAKGIAFVEILWETSGKRWTPKGYAWRDQRWFQWDLETLSEPRLKVDGNYQGEPLAPFKWVTHRPKLKSGLALRGGLARMGSSSFMLKSYTLRDLMAFMDVFGIPLRIGRYDSAASPDDKATLLRAVANLGTDAAAIIPKGMELELVEVKGGSTTGEPIFLKAADWWDRQVSKAVLGQTMTTDDGSSRAQAQVHDKVRLDLMKADARALQATLRRDLATPFVRLNFGPGAPVPKVTVVVEEPEDLKSYIDTVDVAVGLGVEIEASVVRDKLGIPDPAPGAKLLEKRQPPAPSFGGASGDEGVPAPKPGEKTPPKPPAKDDEEAKRAMNRLVVQRTRLALNQRAQDEIDQLIAEELDGWQPSEDPVRALVAQLERAGSPEAVAALLARASETMDLSQLTEELALAMLKARGEGDARNGS